MKISGIVEYGMNNTTDTWGLGIFMWHGFSQRELTLQIGHHVWFVILNGGRMQNL